MPFLPPNQQRQSTEGTIWTNNVHRLYYFDQPCKTNTAHKRSCALCCHCSAAIYSFTYFKVIILQEFFQHSQRRQTFWLFCSWSFILERHSHNFGIIANRPHLQRTHQPPLAPGSGESTVQDGRAHVQGHSWNGVRTKGHPDIRPPDKRPPTKGHGTKGHSVIYLRDLGTLISHLSTMWFFIIFLHLLSSCQVSRRHCNERQRDEHDL